MTIWFATGNVHKKNELADILASELGSGGDISAGYRRNFLIPADAGIAFDPEENGNSFHENALIKARALYRTLCGKNIWRPTDAVIADDSGICVDALDGRPGIFSARYAGKGVPPDNIKLESPQRNALLLEELADNPLRSARFVCSMVLLFTGERFFIANETLEGELVKNISQQRGTGGFGYDPVLYIPEMEKTVAELSEAEKNRISHRGKAGKIIAGIMRNL